MAIIWRQYETLIVFDPELGIEATNELVGRIRSFITNESGRVLKNERWGMRDLAFPMKGRSKGYYFLIEFAGLPTISTEMDRRLNLIDSVLKFQTVKLKEKVDPASLPETQEVTVKEEEHKVILPPPVEDMVDSQEALSED